MTSNCRLLFFLTHGARTVIDSASGYLEKAYQFQPKCCSHALRRVQSSQQDKIITIFTSALTVLWGDTFPKILKNDNRMMEIFDSGIKGVISTVALVKILILVIAFALNVVKLD